MYAKISGIGVIVLYGAKNTTKDKRILSKNTYTKKKEEKTIKNAKVTHFQGDQLLMEINLKYADKNVETKPFYECVNFVINHNPHDIIALIWNKHRHDQG